MINVNISLYLIVLYLSFVLSFNLEIRLPVIKRGTEGSYFGYSVAEHQSVDEVKSRIEHNWLLVGAPLGQNLQPNTNRSGALWKCPVSTKSQDCEQVITDGKRIYDDQGQIKFDSTIDSDKLTEPLDDEIKDNQWLGVTVRSQRPGGKVLVCAHRYIYRGKGTQWGQGLCYTLSQRLDYDNSWEPCKGKPVGKGHEEYGYCQAGTSGMLLKDDTALIGTPGPILWQGTVFVFSVSDDFLRRDMSMYYSPVDRESPVDTFSYLGMSVTAGEYFESGHMVYASGAPRAGETGQVVLFNRSWTADPTKTALTVLQIIRGEQYFSSFGYEVATADVNGDKLPDLLVGAPFYFSRQEGGAVYIYMNEKHCLNCTEYVKLTGKPDSRYGFAIANLGDLNKDGYEDIAIGAPYEGNGTVYIYLGSKKGLILEPSQVIKAESFTNVRTLGYSLSGGQDLDQNGYPDLLIGAYESDSVVFLRARPIVGLLTNVTGLDDIKNIDPLKRGCIRDPNSELTCFTFLSCVTLEERVQIEARPGSEGVELLYQLAADVKRRQPRVWLGSDPDTRRLSTVQKNILLMQDTKTGQQLQHCEEHTVYIKENTKDIQAPIEFKLTYSLVQKEPEVPKEGDDLPSVDDLPILNQHEAEKQFPVTFLKNCGENTICESKLHVEASLELPTSGENKSLWELMLGLHTEVVVNITVYNLQESAYEAQLFITHPPSLRFINFNFIKSKSKQLTCVPFNNTLIACSIGNPLLQDQPPVELHVRFDPKDLEDTQSRLEFTIWANSTSKEVDPDEPVLLRATVVKRAELSLSGLARPEQLLYGGTVRGESAMTYKDDIGSRVFHTYQVYNEGPWRVSNLEIHIEWPFQVANIKPLGKWLLYMDEQPTVEAMHGGECHMAPGQVNPLGLQNRPGLLEAPLGVEVARSGPAYNVTLDSDSGGVRMRRRRDSEMIVTAETVTDKDGRKHKYVKMDCMKGTAKCFKFSCVIYRLEKSQIATVSIKARLWNSTLMSDYPKVDSVSISSRAKIHIPTSLIINQGTSDDVVGVETICKVDRLEQQVAEPVPWWIIIVAIVVGLLVLILLTLLLWKLGFFKRRRPDPTLSGNLEKPRINDDHDY